MNDTDEGSVSMTVALNELLRAARGMAEGDFHRLVTVKAQGEVAQLAHYINHTLQNLQQMDPALRESQHTMPTVASELADVIQATEVVTHRVLDAAEQLLDEQEQLVKSLSDVRAKLASHPAFPTMSRLAQTVQERAMEIMAAMEFQDLASQRISQVVSLVREIEERLVHLLVLFKLQEVSAESQGAPSAQRLLQTLTNQLSTTAGRQEWVDSVLGEFHREV
ncbi:MAG TPA: protein phosphatase CheZ [Methylomirabilota bacterium]|nr:protein phosphatase CheZ [Methylomirabilota bacterium]